MGATLEGGVGEEPGLGARAGLCGQGEGMYGAAGAPFFSARL